MKRATVLFLLITLIAFAGCNGCGDTGGTETTDDNSTEPTVEDAGNFETGVAGDSCVDVDGDGFGTGLTCAGAVDCDDSNPDVHPGAEEVCYDAVDNDCDMTIDEECPDCEEGDSRECGSDEGRCTAGTQRCVDGVWSECEGSEGPFGEVCNGEDDNCNGVVDENPGLLCDDGAMCNGVETCQSGACVVEDPVDCTHLDGPCVEGICSEKDGGCKAAPLENGSECDDGNFCTVEGTCSEGVCETTPRDCSGETDQCNTGVCDEMADSCVKQPVSDGTGCDDGAFCTTGDVCTAGACGGAARDCSGVADQCNTGACDEMANECVPEPVGDGTTCDDGQYCTVGDACMAGQCESGGPRQCGAAGGSCREGTCNEQLDQCDGDPVPDGTACDDDLFCTTQDACQAGSCVGPVPRDCSSEDGLCKVGTCSENLNACIAAPEPDGTACDDGAFCTTGDTCTTGTCAGAPRDCSAVDDACNDGICDDTADSCIAQPKSDGTSCVDSLFCTVAETCVSGTCESDPRDCSAHDDQCNDGICDDMADACAPQPKMDGIACDDGDNCTDSDACVGGSCGGTAIDCSAETDQCNVGMCDVATGGCIAVPIMDGTSCDDGDACTETDVCNAGTCGGSAVDCAGLDDQCNVGMCDPSDGSCYAQPVSDGILCDDGDNCTETDVCTGGACGGADVDCSSLDGECAVGTCDPADGSCFADTFDDGTSCNDGDNCTTGDQCTSGTCAGATVDCSSLDGECAVGTCDPADGSCFADTFDDGTSCNDGDNCTTSDQCTSGSCAGTTVDCSSLDGECAAGKCDPSDGSCFADTFDDGTSCNDGDNCTTADACTSGTCAGTDVDCSAWDQECAVGTCDASDGSCFSDTVDDGTTCDDGDNCTTVDECTGGSCGGTAVDCSSLDSECEVGTCDPADGSCFADPAPLEGMSCIDDQYCSVDETCVSGTCTSGGERDCSSVTGGDSCFDGVCDDVDDQCVAIDNGTCDPCDSGTPIADAGSDQNVVPNTTVQLDGTGSSDPAGQTLSYSWTIASSPAGSTASISNPTSATPTLLADVSGTFEVCLEVTDPDACASAEDCMLITVEPIVDLHIELVWFSDDSDVDLHFRAPNGTWWNRDKINCGAASQGTDTHFCVPNPDWGQGGEGQPDGDPTNDPTLDVDNTSGFGPENINQDVLFDGSPFTVGVHYFGDRGAGDVSARIRVYVGGVLDFEDTRTLSCNDFWTVANIDVSGGGTNVTVTSVDTMGTDTRGSCP